MDEFIIPDFLQDNGADEIQARMLANIPDNMDKSEGSIIWDLTYSPAAEISETVEFVLVELIKNMFPLWAESMMLDEHGNVRGIARRSAEKAKGTVTIKGTVGHIITAGTVLSTTSDDDSETILFTTIEDGTITEINGEGVVTVDIEAVEAGESGNVAAGRINRLDISDLDVTSLSNKQATSGGLDVEDDESYRDRLVDYDRSQGESFIGSVADYKRWALSVSGVGGVAVIPATDDSGTVTLALTDYDGNPASEDVCEDVYNYIMRPDNPELRLANINASLEVMAVEGLMVTISANVETNGVRGIDSIKADFLDKLRNYYIVAIEEGKVKYSEIWALLSSIEGVSDHNSLRINGGTSNISVSMGDVPYSDSSAVTLTTV